MESKGTMTVILQILVYIICPHIQLAEAHTFTPRRHRLSRPLRGKTAAGGGGGGDECD